MYQERDHKEFSPSRSERFIACRGSVNLLRGMQPSPPDAYAIEGKIAHEFIEAGVKNFCRTASDAQFYTRFKGQDLAPFLRSSVIEFKSSVTDALDYIMELWMELDIIWGDVHVYTEKEVNPPTRNAPGQAAGHLDVALYSPKARKIWVIDYKHGVGIVKAAKGNTQVLQYAAGLIFGSGSGIDPATIDGVVLVIIQPRAFHPDGEIRSYEVPIGHVKEYLIFLDGVIADCLRPDAPLNPGEEQCRFCDAKGKCPALQAMSIAVINPDFRKPGDIAAPKMPDPLALDIQRLAYIKSMRGLVDKWFDACDDALKTHILTGGNGHGWKAVEAHARREYDDTAFTEEDRVKRLAALINCQDFELYNVKMKPLTEVEQMLKDTFKSRVSRNRKKQAAEEAAKIFAYFTIKQSSGAITIVEESDPRPAVNLVAKYYKDMPMISPPNTEREKT